MRQTFFKGQTAKRSGMNKTEAEYADMLRVRERAGEILWWRYEAVKLRTTDKLHGTNTTWYTADFAVMQPDGTMELHEVKGGLELAKDILRLKATASLYPFVFVLARKLPKKRGGWQIRSIKDSDAAI